MATDSKTRIGGWLLAPLAWLILTLLTSGLVMTMYLSALLDPALRNVLFSQAGGAFIPWAASLLTSTLMLVYSGWLTWLFCQRSQRVPRHYIIWLLLTVLLALKSFAFSSVTDGAATRTLLIALLAASVLAPYFRRSQRVKATFTER